MIEKMANSATYFIGIFEAGGSTLTSLVTDIIPMLLVLLTFVNAIIKLIGEERFMNFAKKCTKNVIARYTILPIMARIFLADPMCYTFGRFVEEKHKPAFYDSIVSFCHPGTGIFPHSNSAELFVYLGIAAGITTLGLNPGLLAVWYFIVGAIAILIRGIVTEKIYAIMASKDETDEVNITKEVV